ncbi:MAG: hypothetical protein LBS43_00245 [Prevotellaceae bacterium]|jgi:hypothetical protein|nr:hypothetical protein [Prevotellaceae bacterium]
MKRINIIKTCLLLIFTAVIVAGCNREEEESPFTGSDNAIASFTLKKDGVTLKASVISNEIVIAAPERFSLTAATATVIISENAAIEPSPSTISDWDATHTFTVTSYNGAKNVYSYRVERHLVSREGDVVLLTQADVDVFVAELDADQINGSITIGAATGQDSVYSLTGLERLKIITGGIIINATYAGEEITVFENLEKTGELRIMAKKAKTLRFPKLVAVRSGLTVASSTNGYGTSALFNSIDFPELLIVDKELGINYLDSLAYLNFPKLQEVIGTFAIQGSYQSRIPNLHSVNFPALEKVGGRIDLNYLREVTSMHFPELTTVNDVFYTSSLDKLESFNIPKLKTVYGALSLSSGALTTIDFPALETLTGSISISSSATLTALLFPKLESIGSLSLSNFSNLETLQFPKLKYIRNELTLQSLKFTSLSAFSAVDSIGDRIYLYNLPELTSLSGLSSLKKVKTILAYDIPEVKEIDVRGIKISTLNIDVAGDVTLIGDDEFSGELTLSITNGSAVTGFKKVGKATITGSDGIVEVPWLEEVSGLLDIRGNYTQEMSLPNLRSTGGITLGYLYALETLNLPELETITGYTSGTSTLGSFTYSMSNSPTTSFTLPKLKSIVGDLSITYISLAEVISFPALENITGKLIISGQTWGVKAVIADLSGFSTLKSADGVTISNLPELKNFEPLKNVVQSFVSPGSWNVTNCGYNPKYQDMLDGKYSNE